jgi:RNA polymerase sigma-70 factor (ECF subfamily)
VAVFYSALDMDFRPARAPCPAGAGICGQRRELAPDTRESNDDSLRYRQMMQRVNALPEAQRNTVFLVYVEGFTYQEAAETLAVPVGTIMSRLATARDAG